MNIKSRKKNSENVNMYNCESFKLMHINLQSVNGCLGYLQAIVNTMNVDIVTANETNLKGSNKLNLEGYSSFARN